MKLNKIIALFFIILAMILGIIFYLAIEFPDNLFGYFKKEYYSQYGPLAICIELLLAGYYLFRKHAKVNFTLALFAFTVLLDAIFNLFGLFSSPLPVYAMILFSTCAIISIWLAFTDTFNLGKISLIGALTSFVLGNIVELFFNYW
ncbi:hypothetical protein [Winogradskyella sp. A2]|uniref:hypothetical protein n=1 Tax=Winogradskyella sp. A2 TaxID=3366944 RepID=UPI00398C7ED2